MFTYADKVVRGHLFELKVVLLNLILKDIPVNLFLFSYIFEGNSGFVYSFKQALDIKGALVAVSTATKFICGTSLI